MDFDCRLVSERQIFSFIILFLLLEPEPDPDWTTSLMTSFFIYWGLLVKFDPQDFLISYFALWLRPKLPVTLWIFKKSAKFCDLDESRF